ncbi:WXG100 family type VII secretion target [Streptomyces sp. NPDC005483]|uniref:WXG100 family type VII secretion target n=1 Tax=Streptomyces sp. NPDC005483 TaxID=3154882 RepID=UPI0033BE5B85
MPDIGSSHMYVGESLESAGAYMNAKAAEIDADLERLRAKLAPLIETWKAQSADQYLVHMHEWDVAAIGLYGDEAQGGVLGTIAAVMRVNWGNYVNAEEANVKTWTHG